MTGYANDITLVVTAKRLKGAGLHSCKPISAVKAWYICELRIGRLVELDLALYSHSLWKGIVSLI